MVAVWSITWDSASLFPQPSRAGQPLQPGRAGAGSTAWDGTHREEAEDEAGGNVERMLREQPGETAARESGGGCLLTTTPGLSPACLWAATTRTLSCPAELLSVPSDTQQQEHPMLILTPLWLHQVRKNP